MLPYNKSDDDIKMVVRMAGAGVASGMIAQKLGIPQTTLKKYYRDELDLAIADATVQIADILIGRAIEGDMKAAEFYLRAQAGWSTSQTLDVTSKGEHVSGDAVLAAINRAHADK